MDWKRPDSFLSRPISTSVRVLILTTFELDEYVFEALRSGASGFLLKDTEPEDLLRAVRVVAAGEALLSPSVTRTLIGEFVARPERRSVAPDSLALLTDREREVLAAVATGLSNDEIAEELVISPATARTHVSRIMMKLGARGPRAAGGRGRTSRAWWRPARRRSYVRSDVGASVVRVRMARRAAFPHAGRMNNATTLLPARPPPLPHFVGRRPHGRTPPRSTAATTPPCARSTTSRSRSHPDASPRSWVRRDRASRR